MRVVHRLVVLGLMVGCARMPAPAPLAPDDSLVGRRFFDQLDGYSTRVARLLNTDGKIEYSLHYVVAPNVSRLLLAKLLTEGARRPAEFEIVAAVVAPVLGRGEVLVVSACQFNGVTDVDIVAVARQANQPMLSRIQRAWRADGGAAKLVPIPVDGIACEHEGWVER